MNWDALGAIGEIVGAVAVVMTLAYLAVQIRQNTKAVRRSSHQSVVEGFANLNAQLTQDAEVAEIITTGLRQPEELKDNDLVRFERWMGTQQGHFQNLFFQHRDGIIEAERWRGYEVAAREFMGTPGFARYWERARDRFSLSYQEFVDRIRSP